MSFFIKHPLPLKETFPFIWNVLQKKLSLTSFLYENDYLYDYCTISIEESGDSQVKVKVEWYNSKDECMEELKEKIDMNESEMRLFYSVVWKKDYNLV